MKKHILFAGSIGALLGVIISAFVSYNIFHKEILYNRYSIIVNSLEETRHCARIYHDDTYTDKERRSAKRRAEFLYNNIYSLSLVFLPDAIFTELDNLLAKKQFDKALKNKILWNLRKEIFTNTKIKYDDIMQKNFTIIN